MHLTLDRGNMDLVHITPFGVSIQPQPWGNMDLLVPFNFFYILIKICVNCSQIILICFVMGTVYMVENQFDCVDDLVCLEILI